MSHEVMNTILLGGCEVGIKFQAKVMFLISRYNTNMSSECSVSKSSYQTVTSTNSHNLVLIDTTITASAQVIM